MKTLKSLGIGAVLVFAMTCDGQAEMVDMAKMTCKDVLQGTPAEAVVTGAWLSGYFHGLEKSTTVDVTLLSKNTEVVWNYCSDHPDETLMNAVSAVATMKK